VLADDEADLRRLLKARLTRSGFEVLDVEDGKLALALVRAVRPDLVLLDHRMPEMDGGEACRQIKADPDLSVTPVVIVTAGDRLAAHPFHDRGINRVGFVPADRPVAAE